MLSTNISFQSKSIRHIEFKHDPRNATFDYFTGTVYYGKRVNEQKPQEDFATLHDERNLLVSFFRIVGMSHP